MSQRECVKVAVRVRPLLQSSSNEKGTDDVVEVDQNNSTVSILNSTRGSNRDVEEKSFFTFDYAFPPDCTQQEVYEEAASDIVQSVLMGFNGTIFAYGQTGSGKTYTMYGKGTGSIRGIIPRSVNQIFEYVNKKQSDEGIKFNIRASYVQLYNEQILDLLVDPNNINNNNNISSPRHNSTNNGAPKIVLREDSSHAFQMENNVIIPINNIDDINKLISTGKRNRKVRRTQMNDESTRAHTILSIWVESIGNTTQTGRLNLVDLAGSEKSSKAGTEGEALKEGSAINYALLILGNCISALTSRRTKATVVPYRDSPLTKLLKESLGGNAKTLMIATLSPSIFNESESMNTLRYAQKAKMIRNSAIVNMDPKDALLQKYQKELEELQTRLAQQTMYINNSSSSESSFDMLANNNYVNYYSSSSDSSSSSNSYNNNVINSNNGKNYDLEMIQCETERIKKERIEMKKIMEEEEERIKEEIARQNEMVQKIEELSKNRPPPSSDLIRKKERLRRTKEKIDQKKDLIHKEYDDVLETWKKLSMVVKEHIPKDTLKRIYANAEYDEETMQWRMKQKKRAKTADLIHTDLDFALPERPSTPQ